MKSLKERDTEKWVDGHMRERDRAQHGRAHTIMHKLLEFMHKPCKRICDFTHKHSLSRQPINRIETSAAP